MVLEDPGVDLVLHVTQLRRRHRLPVAEVEAELVGAHVGAGLAHVGAEPLAQRGVQEVRGGVVALSGVSCQAVDSRVHPLPGAQLAVLEHAVDRLVLAQPDDLGDAHATVAVGALDHTDVGDLAAPGGVEGRIGELEEDAPVDRFQCRHRGRLLGRLIADEARRETRRAGEGAGPVAARRPLAPARG